MDILTRTRLMPAAAIFAACLSAPLGSAMAAGGFCSEPPVPSCLSAPGGFAGEEEKRRCRYELDSYLSAVQQQANCLLLAAEEEARQRVDKGRRAAQEARAEGRQALARFECKARGNTC